MPRSPQARVDDLDSESGLDQCTGFVDPHAVPFSEDEELCVEEPVLVSIWGAARDRFAAAGLKPHWASLKRWQAP